MFYRIIFIIFICLLPVKSIAMDVYYDDTGRILFARPDGHVPTDGMLALNIYHVDEIEENKELVEDLHRYGNLTRLNDEFLPKYYMSGGMLYLRAGWIEREDN